MDMGPAGFIKQPGDKIFIKLENSPTDRTNPGPVSLKAIGTTGDIHKPVCLSHGGKGRGFYPLPPQKPDRTNRTGSGRSGFALKLLGLFFPSRPGGKSSPPRTKKERIPKPKENHPDKHKTHNLKIRIHIVKSILNFQTIPGHPGTVYYWFRSVITEFDC
jgi:hypothetical protein